MNRRATMSDVARVARVGKITVSRVLNGNPHVAEKTKKRVLAAVKKLGYVPDEAARCLRSRKSRCIGLITHSLLNPFFAVVADAIHDTAQRNGYMVMTVSSQGDYDVEAAQIQTLLCRRVDGLVIVPASSRKCIVSERGFGQLPVVAFDRPLPDKSHDCVLVENQQGARMAVEHLVAHGHRRLAILGPGEWYTIRERREGFRQAASEHDIETVEMTGVNSLPNAIAALKKLLDSPMPPTAVFTTNNMTTMLVFEALQELGVDIPGRLALVGFDNFELARILRPPLTVVAQPIREMARRAAELLFERLESGEAAGGPPRRISLPVELIIRDSCGCRQHPAHPIETVSEVLQGETVCS